MRISMHQICYTSYSIDGTIDPFSFTDMIPPADCQIIERDIIDSPIQNTDMIVEYECFNDTPVYYLTNESEYMYNR